MVMIVEGLPYFAVPEKMKYWVQKVVATPDSSLRRLGLVLMTIGLLLVYFGRKAIDITNLGISGIFFYVFTQRL